MEAGEIFRVVKRSPPQEIPPRLHVDIQKKLKAESKARGEVFHVPSRVQIDHIEIEHHHPHFLERCVRELQLLHDDTGGRDIKRAIHEDDRDIVHLGYGKDSTMPAEGVLH